MKILIFIENNILNSENAPIGAAVKKINAWKMNGAEVEFITARTKFLELKELDDRLKELGVENPKIHAKQAEGARFVKMLEEIKPHVFIENKDNAGTPEPICQRLGAESTARCILLPPGLGIDNLPDDLEALKELGQAKEPPVDKNDDTY